MDPITLSRLQFALTTIYHWLFVPLTLGLGWFVAFMHTRYYQTKDGTGDKMYKFWGKLFRINFAIGVVTGIVQEFQFGMNWSEYSRYVGDIFGAPWPLKRCWPSSWNSTSSVYGSSVKAKFHQKYTLLRSGWLPSARTSPCCGSCLPMAGCSTRLVM